MRSSVCKIPFNPATKISSTRQCQSATRHRDQSTTCDHSIVYCFVHNQSRVHAWQRCVRSKNVLHWPRLTQETRLKERNERCIWKSLCKNKNAKVKRKWSSNNYGVVGEGDDGDDNDDGRWMKRRNEFISRSASVNDECTALSQQKNQTLSFGFGFGHPLTL